jgi:hypothetical protein
MTTRKVKLAGVRYRTRKRNIVVDFNPTGFKETLISIIKQSLDAESVFPLVDQKEDDLDFKRYGLEFLVLYFSGGMGACVGKHDNASNLSMNPSLDCRKKILLTRKRHRIRYAS